MSEIKEEKAVHFKLPGAHFDAILKQAEARERSIAYIMREIVAKYLGGEA